MPYSSSYMQDDDDHHDKSSNFMNGTEELFALRRGLPQLWQRKAKELDGVLRKTRPHETRDRQYNHANIQKAMNPLAQLVLELGITDGGCGYRMGDTPAQAPQNQKS
jgi:hypothetical protein